jgi:hypothetical protein
VADDERRDGPAGGEGAVVGRPSLVVGLRIFLLIAAASAVAIAVSIAARGRGGDATIRYACPMHLDVRSANPGECPICRMALERVGFVPGSVKPYLEAAGTVDLRAIDNVKKHNVVDFVRRHALLPVLRELRGPAWVDDDGTIAAIFYNDQIEAMAPDETASFRASAPSAATIAARRTADAPVSRDRSTSLIRFRPTRPLAHRASTSAEIGWLEVGAAPRARCWAWRRRRCCSRRRALRAGLVGHGYTFVQTADRDRRDLPQARLVSVLSGLQPNDRVIARATFFVDADRSMGANAGEIALRTAPMIARLVAWSARHHWTVIIASLAIAIACDLARRVCRATWSRSSRTRRSRWSPTGWATRPGRRGRGGTSRSPRRWRTYPGPRRSAARR